MKFISPMLAGPMPKKGWTLVPGQYVAEEKYDGHRLIVAVEGSYVHAWARSGLTRALPQPLINQLAKLPNGTYDGELIIPNGGKSHNVVEIEQASNLTFVIFDVLILDGTDATGCSYADRRAVLEELARQLDLGEEPMDRVALAAAQMIISMEDLEQLKKTVWARGGEGLILKDVRSPYSIGKRPKGIWIKLKALRSTTITIIGFAQGLNGPYAKVVGRDDMGVRVVVKTKNNAELDRCARNPEAVIGRVLRIEYQEATDSNKYRHPRWDRFEDE